MVTLPLLSSSTATALLSHLNSSDPMIWMWSLTRKSSETSILLSQPKELYTSALKKVHQAKRLTSLTLSLPSSSLLAIGCNSQPCSMSLLPWSTSSTTLLVKYSAYGRATYASRCTTEPDRTWPITWSTLAQPSWTPSWTSTRLFSKWAPSRLSVSPSIPSVLSNSSLSWRSKRWKELTAQVAWSSTTTIELTKSSRNSKQWLLLFLKAALLERKKTWSMLRWDKPTKTSPWFFKSRKMSWRQESSDLLARTTIVLEHLSASLTTWSLKLK